MLSIGPILVDEEAGTVYYCSCSQSKNAPYCDGSHADSGLVPYEVAIDSPRKVAVCACRQSGNRPFCDGAHKGV